MISVRDIVFCFAGEFSSFLNSLHLRALSGPFRPVGSGEIKVQTDTMDAGLFGLVVCTETPDESLSRVPVTRVKTHTPQWIFHG